jgi:Fe-S oxidoreductase
VLTVIEKILFLVLAGVCSYYAYTGFKRIVDAVKRGEKGYYPRLNELPKRITDAVVKTLSQTTVFRARPWVSFFHSFIFYGFMFYLLVNVFDGLRGFIPPSWIPWSFGSLGAAYRLLADILTVLILVGVVFFVIRRFGAKDKRLEQNPNTLLHEKVKAGSIKRDSLIVATFIFLHVGFRFLGEGFLLASEGHRDAFQPFASLLASAVGFGENRIIGWHIGWWGALGLILAFLPYFPRSKHIHLFAAPAKFTVERRNEEAKPVPRGALEPINFEDESVTQYGAAKLEHLRFPQLLDAYACIQCNRCTNVCPANHTGKALSPAAIEINKRYEFNTIIPEFSKGVESPKELLGLLLNEESLWACTTCGACMEVCPVGCEQMIDIVDIRRDQIMMKGEFPAELANTFRNLERAGNPWGLSADKRLEWAQGLDVKTVEENPDFEVLFWVGCAGSYDPAAQATTKSMIEILNHANINYAVIGKAEKCTGDPARRAGNEYLYYQLATENVETLNNILIEENLDKNKKKKVVTTCPHCFNALFNDYPQLGGHYDVVHHTQFLECSRKKTNFHHCNINRSLTTTLVTWVDTTTFTKHRVTFLELLPKCHVIRTIASVAVQVVPNFGKKKNQEPCAYQRTVSSRHKPQVPKRLRQAARFVKSCSNLVNQHKKKMLLKF